jgi:hypothetical protein
MRTLWHQLKEDKSWFEANPPTGLTLEKLAAGAAAGDSSSPPTHPSDSAPPS